MRMVIQIAKAELRNLFYSPVAWFLVIAFLVQCAWVYTTGMHGMAKQQDVTNELYPGLNPFELYPLTGLFFTQPGGLFQMALENLYLFIPLLTMGMISREVNSGTVKLIYSSPVKMRQLVMGKYLALMVYNVVLVSVLGIFLVTAMFNFKSPDYGLLLSASLGFYLLTCAYGAIGIFMSSLSNYQIISAIGTFLIIFVLTRIGTLWQDIPFVRDLTYFLYLAGRTGKMLRGLIASKDVIYFLMVIYIFLGFTLVRLRNAKEKKPWYVKSMRSIGVIASALLVGYVCSFPHTTFYLDPTENEKNTIHNKTRQLLKEIGDEELEVTLYTNLLGAAPQPGYGLPNARNFYLEDMWEKYLRFKPNIKFRYVYYYYYDKSIDRGKLAMMLPDKSNEEMAIAMAKLYRADLNLFKTPGEIKKIIDLEPEDYQMVMQLKYKGRTEYLRTYLTNMTAPKGAEIVWPSEMNTAATLERLLYPERKPGIMYVTGHFTRSIQKRGEREYWNSALNKTAKTALINNGFDIDSIALDKQEIPGNIGALVLADPKTNLSETEQQKIRDFIDKGGNMLILGEPGKQEILNPILRQLGVGLMDGTLVEPTFHEMPQMVRALMTPTIINIGNEPAMLKARLNLKNSYSTDTTKMLMPGVAAISNTDSNGFIRKPILLSNGSKTWIRKATFVTDSAAIVYRPEEGDVKGVFSTGLQLTRRVGNKQQRIVITGDADYLSNQRFGGAQPFHSTVMHWITGEEYPVYLPRPLPSDNMLTVTGRTMKVIHNVYVYALPAIILIIGTVLLIRRKRK